MQNGEMDFHYLLPFYFKKGPNAAQAAKRQVLFIKMVPYKWFPTFKSGHFNLKDLDNLGRPAVVDDDQQETLKLIHINDMGHHRSTPHVNVVRHLKAFGHSNRYHV